MSIQCHVGTPDVSLLWFWPFSHLTSGVFLSALRLPQEEFWCSQQNKSQEHTDLTCDAFMFFRSCSGAAHFVAPPDPDLLFMAPPADLTNRGQHRLSARLLPGLTPSR